MKQQSQYEVAIDSTIQSVKSDWYISRSHTAGFEWLQFSPLGVCIPDQGWKIHLSVAAHEACYFISAVLPALIEFQMPFKIPNKVEGIVKLNAGDAGYTQVGKIVTIYPANVDFASKILAQLKEKWPSTHGPAVPSDLPINGTNSIFVRYGAFSKKDVSIDEHGRHQQLITDPDGTSVIDFRTADGTQPSWVDVIPDAGLSINGHEEIFKSTDFLPLLLISKSAKGKVYIGVQISNGSPVLIKTATRGVAGDMKGFDAVRKLQNEFKCIELVKDLDIAPKAIDYFYNGHQAMLVTADVGGVPLKNIGKNEQLLSLPRIARLLGRLHKAGVVHRDVKIDNFIISAEKVYIIDFELSARKGATDIPSGGTWGHIPSDQHDIVAAEISDVFAFASLASGVLLGCCPSAFPNGKGRIANLLGTVGQARLKGLVLKLFKCESDELLFLSNELVRISTKSRQPVKRFSARRIKNELNWARRASVSAGRATHQYLQSTHEGTTWRNAHFESDFLCEGINLGCAGIIIGLSAIQSAHRHAIFDNDIRLGAEWLAAQKIIGSAPGCFVGSAGVALALSLVAVRQRNEQLLRCAQLRMEHAVSNCREYDLFFGAAGVLLACTIIYELFGFKWALTGATSAANRLKSGAIDEDGLIVWPFVLPFENSNHAFLGAAHGAAGIAFALAQWARVGNDHGAHDLACETFAKLTSFATILTVDGPKLRRRLGSGQYANSREWCHGALGVLWAALASRLEDPRIDRCIDWGVDCISETTHISNPTYCHGMAGQLETFSMLRRRPKYQQWADDQAFKLALAMRSVHQKIDGDVVWGAEDPRTVTPDLWVGFLGPACALALYSTGQHDPLFSAAIFKSTYNE